MADTSHRSCGPGRDQIRMEWTIWVKRGTCCCLAIKLKYLEHEKTLWGHLDKFKILHSRIKCLKGVFESKVKDICTLKT